MDGEVDEGDAARDLRLDRLGVVPNFGQPAPGHGVARKRFRADRRQRRHGYRRRLGVGIGLAGPWAGEPATGGCGRSGHAHDQHALGVVAKVATVLEPGGPGELELHERKAFLAGHGRDAIDLDVAGRYSPTWAPDARRPLSAFSP